MKTQFNLIAVDYDDTISDRKQAWLKILSSMVEADFEIIIVTFRKPDCDPEDLAFLAEAGYKIYFTGQKAKRPFLKKLGIKPAIWIDDSPESVIFDYDGYKGKYKSNENQDFQLIK